MGEKTALVPLIGGGAWYLTRLPLSGRYVFPRPLTSAELAHPALGGAACVLATWLGREAFHAGCIQVRDGAWGVLGRKESGKSTLLAYLATSCIPVLADDMTVVDPRSLTAYAGPRCIDLRLDAAKKFHNLELAREDQRMRLALKPVEPEVPLKGWIILKTGPGVSLERVSPSDRVNLLLSSRTLRVPPRDPAVVLSLAALPFFELQRPLVWDQMEVAASALVQGLD